MNPYQRKKDILSYKNLMDQGRLNESAKIQKCKEYAEQEMKIPIGQMLGKGANGEVYKVRDKPMAIKFMVSHMQAVLDEISVAKAFAEIGLGPKIYAYDGIDFHDGTAGGIIVMDTIVETLKNVIAEDKASFEQLEQIALNVIKLIHQLCNYNLRHNDMNWDNIAFKADGSLIFIDFGFSKVNVPCNPRIEVLQILNSIYLNTLNRYAQRNVSKEVIGKSAHFFKVMAMEYYNNFFPKFEPLSDVNREYMREIKQAFPNIM